MRNFIAETEICEKCGTEISGELCVNCYTKEDQSFESCTPGENATRLIFVGFGLALLAIVYSVHNEVYPSGELLTKFTHFITFGAFYSLYVACLYILVALKIITKETAKRFNIVGRMFRYFF